MIEGSVVAGRDPAEARDVFAMHSVAQGALETNFAEEYLRV